MYTGIVLAHFGDSIAVEYNNIIYTCFIRPNMEDLVVGDTVEFIIKDQKNLTGQIENLKPRRSMLARSRNQKLKPIVANIDQINIVISVQPMAQAYLIDQFIINSVNNNIDYLIILNKTDLYRNKDYQQLRDLRDNYKKLKIAVLGTSAKRKTGLKRLTKKLANKTSIFVGQSGVGKSSLISCLIDEKLTTNTLTKKGQLGSHTTSCAQLYHLPFGGQIIDAPGVREIGINHFDKKQIARGFPELEKLIGTCKFRDCSHTHEPGCKFLAALKNGEIEHTRFERFLKFLSQVQA
jgi:ribosome biogenesis GTPase